MLASIGAYIASDRQLLTPFGQIGTVVGMYDIPAAYVTIDAVLSNTSPTAPYRGAGRPEASYLIERAMEAAAHELNIDPIELRRRNIIPDAKMPYKTRARPVLRLRRVRSEHGDGAGGGDHAGFAARREASRAQGMLRGIGFANAIEQAAGPTPEYAEIRFQPERQRDPADGHQDARPGPRDRRSSRSCAESSASTRTRCSSSTATPIASHSAWARTGRARWWSAAPR